MRANTILPPTRVTTATATTTTSVAEINLHTIPIELPTKTNVLTVI